MTGKVLLAALQAYSLGSIPFGYFFYRIRQGGDIRAIGSGNIGATNVLRGAGTAAGAATLVLDAAKGYLAVALAALLTGHAPKWTSLAALLAILGHVFPVFLKFRGGKGVATAFGAFLAIAPFAVLCVAALFVVVAVGSRYVSLASIVAAAALPVVLIAYGGASPYVLATTLLGAALIISRHSSNIHRLLLGTESRIKAIGGRE